MINHIKTIFALFLLIIALPTLAQDNTKTHLTSGRIEPYPMQVTYDKTTHLIFPAAIRYVDLGSEYLVASKAEDAENVLRVKAATRDFKPETNISIITTDGRFYSFNVSYSSCPETTTYDLHIMQKTADKAQSQEVLFEELGSSTPSLVELILETIYQKNKSVMKHIGSKSFGMQFTLKGLYIHDGKYYFHTQLENQTNVPFRIDFINFKVVDKKTAKRTVVQERSITPIRTYKPLDTINATTTDQNVFLLDQFTLVDDKILLIEIYEKNGGRQQTLQVENTDLTKAQSISDLHLKF